MSQQSAVEFVCYQEGGVIDLQQALDYFLEPTLDQLLKAQRERPEIEEPVATDVRFRPSLCPLPLYRSADDLLAHLLFRDRIEVKAFQPEERSYLLASPTVERVYPFRKPSNDAAIGADAAAPTDLTEAGPALPRYRELDRASSTSGPVEGQRVYPFNEGRAPSSAMAQLPKPTSGVTATEIVGADLSETTIDVTPTRVNPPTPVRRAIEAAQPLAKPHSENLEMVVSNRRVVEQLSFHDLLAARSRKRDEVQPRSITSRIEQWPKILTRIAADSTLFAGFAAIGAGILALIRQEPLDNGAGALILGGVAVVGSVLLYRVLSKPKNKNQLIHARL